MKPKRFKGMHEMEKMNEIVEFYRNNFSESKKQLLSSFGKKEEAIEKLENLGFPTLKHEEWRYTNVDSILKGKFTPVLDGAIIDKTDLEGKFPGNFDSYRIVFVDGVYSPELSDKLDFSDGIVAGSLKEIHSDRKELVENYLGRANQIKTGFDALNEAFASDGFFAFIPRGKSIDKPIQVLFLGVSEGKLNTPRNLIVAEQNASAKFVFTYKGLTNNKYFTDTVNEIFADENSQIEIYKLQDESLEAFHIDKTSILQKNSSIVSHYSFSFGASLARNDINTVLDGENITANLYGLYLGGGKRHVDHHTFVDHAKPNSYSNELYKGILDDESNGVFGGKILVRKDAQKTNAYQSNKNVILTNKASVDTKPQLEIYADDVKCSHGATVGKLNEDAYFYIRSRGVPSEIAKSMLIRAFASDVIENVKIDELKEKLNHMIFDHLQRIEI